MSVDHREALSQLRREGFVLIEDFLPRELVDDLREQLLVAFRDKRARAGIAPVPIAHGEHPELRVGLDFRPEGGNHDLNRWNMLLPSRRPFLDPRLIAEPFVSDLLRRTLGDPCLFLLGCDIAMPGSGLQSAHQDLDRLGLTIQFALVDVGDRNGPTEVWPGSHLPFPCDGVDYSPAPHWHTPAQLRRIVETIPARRITMPAGSLFIRDQRLVHRGTVNRTATPRPLISLWAKDGTAARPHASLVTLATACARGLQRLARGSGGATRSPAVLDLANSLRLRTDELAGSDRHGGREIAGTLWRSLPPEQRGLLRYARVRGARGEDGLGSTPVSADLRLVRLFVRSLLQATSTKRYREQDSEAGAM